MHFHRAHADVELIGNQLVGHALDHQLHHAALAVGQLAQTAEQHMAQGRGLQVLGRLLQRLLDAWQPPFPGFHLYYPSREQLAPKLRVFVDFMRDANAVSS